MLSTRADPDDRTAAEPVSATAYRTMMAAFPAGVAVVTAADEDGQQYGMTCTAVSSVSVSPPTLLVCIQHSSRTLAVLSRTGTFAVNLLDDRARAVAELFAARRPDRFQHVAWTARPGCGGPHLAHDAHSIADCRVTGSVPVADHVVVFGEVFGVTGKDAPPHPLVYGMREYWSLAHTGDAHHAAARPGKASTSDPERKT
ncbi:flavin reductase family protein [Streptomyces rubradiris]|uniref:FMN reductase (NADH) RutF n=1 Tax=Streptomyces rubradiris TaxID=285531 RepID=A0ABQ3RL68_STRRR|nr:flavin reductase family protein [Streptomyces rubradiris]GHH10584.1 FMN reductase (NADH) RutF [Streptomyces rubradiris]GHI56602.1 FMN reductase (NADH) RutF [Streptomyces rubradiris]